MRYIRFLKTPRIIEEKPSSKAHIYCLITITSDLGDSFLPTDVTLSAGLYSAGARDDIILWKSLQWKTGMRALPVTLPLSRSRLSQPLKVYIGVEPCASYDIFSNLYEDSPGLVSAWSAALNLTQHIKEAPRFVQRRFSTAADTNLTIWEETSESIARHLWDAGITLSCQISELAQRSQSSGPLSEAFRPKIDKKRLRVVELGTGCGMVGISVAQSFKSADVIMTDLPEAEEIVKKNIQNAKPAKDSTMVFRTLNWDEKLPRYLSSDTRLRASHHGELDVVIATDCTYNPDSSPALVNTMARLVRMSPNVTVVVAMKMRHSSEDVFFDLMSAAGFRSQISLTIPLPGDEQAGEEKIHVYFYKYQVQEHMTDP